MLKSPLPQIGELRLGFGSEEVGEGDAGGGSELGAVADRCEKKRRDVEQATDIK